MSVTKIEWTDRTWNPVRGCSRVSEGCRNCYAERMAARFSGLGVKHGKGHDAFRGFATLDPPRWTGRVELITSKLDEPLHWRKPQRVFVNSMSDLFHEGLSDESIASVFSIMSQAPAHTFQILTKRAQRLPEWFRWAGQGGNGRGVGGSRIAGASPGHVRATRWPLVNVWVGVSVEDQPTADARVPFLLRTPAEKRFVSYEPALGPVNFGSWLCRDYSLGRLTAGVYLDQIIVGGESGPGARPFDLVWAKRTRAACQESHAAFFMKQWGAKPFDSSARGNDYIAAREHRKGSDPEEWPEDLRVREFPA